MAKEYFVRIQYLLFFVQNIRLNISNINAIFFKLKHARLNTINYHKVKFKIIIHAAPKYNQSTGRVKKSDKTGSFARIQRCHIHR